MSLTAFALRNKVITWFTVALLAIAGVFSFFKLGQLEDPVFTVKTALVMTPYPGASAEQVELEVTDKIENVIQEMPELKSLHSRSTPGLSLITVEIKGEYWSDRLPQVWDKLRRKIGDVQGALPTGTVPSTVIDEFGDVYGMLVGVIGDGYSYQAMEDYVKQLKKEISLVKGVAKVGLWGNQQSVVYLDVSEGKLSNLGLSFSEVTELLKAQNLVVDAGHVESGQFRLNIHPSGSFTSPQDIGDLLVHVKSRTNSNEFIRINDIGTIREGYVEPAKRMMRLNGRPAIVLSIAPLEGTNVVEVGKLVAAKIDQMSARFPVGLEVEKIHWQPQVVDESVNSFLVNFAQAVMIVLVVLAIAMGWKMGVVIGSALVLTILGTFFFLALFGIDLHRMSLGALIIALGMMVDNAIVVAEGYVVKLQKGASKAQAALESAQTPSMPLLGATIIAIMAFYPIFASNLETGEYCRTLFIVVAISLLVSWFVSLTLTPLQCMLLLDAQTNDDDKEGKLLSTFRSMLELALKQRLVTVGSLIFLLMVALGTFGNVKQIFFPNSAMTKFMVDVWKPQGSRLQATSDDISKIEQHLLQDERVKTVSSFIGEGSPRFYLPVSPENPNPAFGQLIVNVHNYEDSEAVTSELRDWLTDNMPDAMTRVRRYTVGPAITWTFEARFIGPADADPTVLRELAEQGAAILRDSSLAKHISTDWRQQTLRVVPEYSQIKGRTSGISRSDLASTTKRFYDGNTVGTYRRADTQLPIIVREDMDNRDNKNLELLQIESSIPGAAVPLDQVVDGIKVEWENSVIWRYNRHRAITVQASPIEGMTPAVLRQSVLEKFEQIKLPEGYTLHWFGEHKSTTDSNEDLKPGMLPMFGVILLILVGLFNAMRPMLIIMLLLPFVMIGVSAGLQLTGAAFGFVAILGVMSLIGMISKNAIVLIDQINLEKEQGKTPHQAIIDAAVSRVRPVFLAAATTVLGVIPLIPDLFWQGLAVSIMAGLSFGTILTMVLLPVFYSLFYKTHSKLQ
ncbi:efflux RND transporter permease subunit [Pseudoalteromonas sp. DL2-H2.2]|uniref:efflux RND transporter permease subunit n=1 Tax=Pseudoalteromonas sp. DL2-H2.2 TaxID=2908889 RepID=UPI001F17D740|nr:efflux RND transporter permease subunit [Pseudoalteromonas sp. DL2-H2.2]MCF2909358.1 efflux RND transporter permease subunit [Pseudoalteromonas sp. DL2-H2.2]